MEKWEYQTRFFEANATDKQIKSFVENSFNKKAANEQKGTYPLSGSSEPEQPVEVGLAQPWSVAPTEMSL